MTERILIAGFGGQGIMLAGKALAHAAMLEGRYVTWLPCYGAEVRGGTAYCMVMISDKPVASPYVDCADSAIIMNAPSLGRFLNRVAPKGLLLENSSLIPKKTSKKGITTVRVRCSDIARELGDPRMANMVALGAYCVLRKTVKLHSLLETIRLAFPEEATYLLNEKAIKGGMKACGRRK